MQIVGLPILNEAIHRNPESGPMLRAFHALVAAAAWADAEDLEATLPLAGQDGPGHWRLVLNRPALVLSWSVNFAAGLVVIDRISFDVSTS
ncbi:hypothetical protein [Phreatobacter stygius]|uniref:Uncharacterized protein n=1 Tax=Phreatobacter stygius TaxID=1940610 RepID=A0A4D7BJ09_9HYPH|nr:hypothetical protein [Phreatobacter stygius]QCI67727.1 hypothetical protein E8M01_28000 [Phreatobacter stygius]